MPVGAFLAGLVLKLPIGLLASDLLPLILISAVIACGLIFLPELMVRVFSMANNTPIVAIANPHTHCEIDRSFG